MIDIQPKDTSKGHFYVSLAKSAVRVAAGVAIIMIDVNVWATIAGSLFIVAEILGVVEEIV